jgi:hypothetical protein
MTAAAKVNTNAAAQANQTSVSVYKGPIIGTAATVNMLAAVYFGSLLLGVVSGVCILYLLLSCCGADEKKAKQLSLSGRQVEQGRASSFVPFTPAPVTVKNANAPLSPSRSVTALPSLGGAPAPHVPAPTATVDDGSAGSGFDSTSLAAYAVAPFEYLASGASSVWGGISGLFGGSATGPAALIPPAPLRLTTASAAPVSTGLSTAASTGSFISSKGTGFVSTSVATGFKAPLPSAPVLSTAPLFTAAAAPAPSAPPSPVATRLTLPVLLSLASTPPASTGSPAPAPSAPPSPVAPRLTLPALLALSSLHSSTPPASAPSPAPAPFSAPSPRASTAAPAASALVDEVDPAIAAAASHRPSVSLGGAMSTVVVPAPAILSAAAGSLPDPEPAAPVYDADDGTHVPGARARTALRGRLEYSRLLHDRSALLRRLASYTPLTVEQRTKMLENAASVSRITDYREKFLELRTEIDALGRTVAAAQDAALRGLAPARPAPVAEHNPWS